MSFETFICRQLITAKTKSTFQNVYLKLNFRKLVRNHFTSLINPSWIYPGHNHCLSARKKVTELTINQPKLTKFLSQKTVFTNKNIIIFYFLTHVKTTFGVQLLPTMCDGAGAWVVI